MPVHAPGYCQRCNFGFELKDLRMGFCGPCRGEASPPTDPIFAAYRAEQRAKGTPDTPTAPLSEAELAELDRSHNDDEVCITCSNGERRLVEQPCRTRQLVAEVRRLRAALGAIVALDDACDIDGDWNAGYLSAAEQAARLARAALGLSED